MPIIRIEDEVMDGLKKLAEPFVDTPSSVIRRLLEEKGVIERVPLPSSRQAGDAARASSSAPISQATYENFLLYTLEEKFAGSADKRSVTQEVVERLSKRGLITSADLELVSTGETKAENMIAWGRNALKDRGLISRDSPRGVWELTSQGRAAAKRIQLPIRKST